MKKSFALLTSCLSLLTAQAFATSAAGDCKVFDDTAIVTWTEFDDINGYIHVYGATGDVGTNSSTWTAQELSVDPVGSFYMTAPRLFMSEVTGDVIALWQYYDDNTGLLRVGGAVLPVGTTTWSTQLVSDSTNQQGLAEFDGRASFDANGNILVTWSSYDLTLNDYDVLGATAVLASGTTTWNNSFVIPGGTVPFTANTANKFAAKPPKSKNPKIAPANPMKDRKPPAKVGKQRKG